MFIEINGNSKELRFDLNFIRNLNERFQAEMNGFKLPMGVTLATMQLEQGDYSALSDVIRCAVNNSLSQETIDGVVGKYADEGKLDELLEEVKSEMGKSSFVKNQLNKAAKQSKK